jgi:hypothetical protein
MSAPTLAASATRQLGCATDYTVALMPRGGAQAGPALGVLTGINSVEWDRTIDDSSTCTVVIAMPQTDAQCCRTVAQVEKFATELAVFRHTAAGVDKVWEGPVIQKEESLETGQFTVTAYDVAEWLKVRVNHTDWVFPQGLDPAQLAAYYVADAFLPDDPHVTEHMVVASAGGTPVTDNTPAETVNVWQHMSQLLQSAVDITTVGRRLIICGQGGEPWTRQINLGPDDIAGDVLIGDDGTNYCNRVIAIGSSVSRTAKRTLNGQIVQDDPTLPILAGDADDTYHGLVEHVVKMNQVTTRAEAWASAAALVAFAAESGYVKATDGAALQPTAMCGINELVCGTRINLVPSPYFCSPLPQQATLALAHLAVTFTPDTGERVGISVGIANQNASLLLQSGS